MGNITIYTEFLLPDGTREMDVQLSENIIPANRSVHVHLGNAPATPLLGVIFYGISAVNKVKIDIDYPSDIT